MKIKLIYLAFLALVLNSTFTSCSKNVEILVDSSKPQGAFTASKSGSIVEQNGTGSKGAIQIGLDTKNVQFVKFGSDFITNQATGTVSVYLSTSEKFKADPGMGNPDLRLLGIVSKNGEQYFIADPIVQSKFTHVILWCGTAGIPFGYAKIQ